MRSLFIFVAILSSVPAIFIKPHVGILIWSWISYMNPHKLTYGPAFSFPFLDVIAGATIVAFFLSVEPKKIPQHPILAVLLIFTLYMAFTSIGAFVPTEVMLKGPLFAKILLFTVLTIMLITSRSRLDAFIWVIALSLGYFGIKGGLFTITTGGTSIVWGPPGGFISDNNQLALALVMLVPLLRYLSLHAPNKYLRIALMVSIVVVLVSILGSQSRGAFLAVSAMLLFMILLSDKRLIALALGVTVGLTALLFMPQSWTDRMESMQADELDNSAESRLKMWRFTLDMVADKPTGGGYGAIFSEKHRSKYLPQGYPGYSAHSIYFEVLGEHGYPGLFIFFWLGLTTFFSAGTIIRMAKKCTDMQWAGDLARMVQVSLVGYASAGAFLNLSTFDLYYHLMAIVVILHIIVAKKFALQSGQDGWSIRNILTRPDKVAPTPIAASREHGSQR